MTVSLSSNWTLSFTDLRRVHTVNCTTASDMTLPIPGEEDWVDITNVGTANLTIKDSSAATLAILTTGDRVRLFALNNSSSVPYWDKPVAVNRTDAGLVSQGRIVVKSAGKGIVLQSADGSVFELVVSNGGALVVVDHGSSTVEAARSAVAHTGAEPAPPP